MLINRVEFINQLAEQYGYSKKSAATLVSDFMDMVLWNIENGNTVAFQGFGKFDIIERAARQCKNPQTGEDCVVPAHLVPRFYPGISMKHAVKKWETVMDRRHN